MPVQYIYKLKTLYYSIIISVLSLFVVNIDAAYAQGSPEILRSSSSLLQISSSGNNVYIMWSDYDQKERVYLTLFRAIHDGGKSIGHIYEMGNSFSGPTFSQMASRENNLYITQGNVLKKSSDYGITFNDTIPVSTPVGGISNIVATGNNVYLTFDNVINSGNSFEVLFAASKDNGTTFGNSVKLFGMPESSEDYSQIAASGTNVYVVGEGKYGGLQGPIGVLYRASRDGGATFSDTIDLSGNNSTDYAPKVATSGNYVYVAWSELTSDKKNTDLILRMSNDGGETFGPKIRLNQDNSSSGTYGTYFIQLLARDFTLYVKWWDVHFLPNGTETDHLLFDRIINEDATVGKTIEFTGNGARPTDIGHNSMISVGGNNVYALWSEYPNQSSSQMRIFLRTSNDGGFSFGNAIDINNQTNLSGRNGMTDAQITTDGNNVYVAGDVIPPALGILFGTSTDNGKTFDGITDIDADVIPEFLFAMPLLLIGMVSVMITYRILIRK